MGLPAGTHVGPYEILALLGAGGMGEVYRARDPRLGRDVAIKVIASSAAPDADRLHRFEQEARATAALDHPNILAVHDVGTSEGRPYVVSEFLDGEDLRTRLAVGALPVRKALDYATQIAQGLGSAHEKGIVHRDLKPENLFITRDDRVKILDFGLAKLTRPSFPEAVAPLPSTGVTPTGPESVLGTVGYMSPEQVRGRAVDHRSDLFAFGTILYEMLSGRRAFARGSAFETMNAILKEDPPEISRASPDLPAALERIVQRCLEKDPHQRFQSARDLGFALETVLGSPASSAEAVAAARQKPTGRRSVAVLPFQELSRNPENAHLGLGLADATITELAGMKSLIVRPTSAVLRYQDRTADAQQAGRELSVDAVLNGSFQRVGSRLRVTVQLVGTAEGRPLWGTKIDTSVDDVFRMQDDVSRKIAQVLAVELTPAEERRLSRARPAGEGYELYLKGRLHLFHETLSEVNVAIECFEKAAQADPALPLAWVGLADAYVRMGFTFDPEGGWYTRAEAMCEKALALDPRLPEGHYLRARLLWSPHGRFDHAGALRELGVAISTRPSLNEAHDWLGIVLVHLGLFEESLHEFERALMISPDDLFAHQHLGFSRYHQGRYEEALVICEAVAHRAPSSWLTYDIALCQLQLGRLEEAQATVERAARLFPGDVLAYPVRGLIAARQGNGGEAKRQIQLTVRNKRSFGHYHHAQYDVACINALMGESDEAMEWLTAASSNGYPCHALFERDALLQSIREDERFARLMSELRTECDGYRKIYAEMQSSLDRDTSGA